MKSAGSTWKSKLLLTTLWISFGVLWYRVYTISTMQDVKTSTNYVLGLIGAYGLLVTLWIFHNIRIYRTKGPRSQVRTVYYEGSDDTLKRTIARKVDVRSEQEIIVTVEGNLKVFRHGTSAVRETVGGTR